MRATNALLHHLRDKTDMFRLATADLFECDRSAALMLAGKGLDCVGSPAANLDAWNASGVAFDHSRAAQKVVEGVLRTAAMKIVDFALKQTSMLAELSVEWIMEHPFALPVLVNASGPRSKKKFRDDLSIGNANDRKIGRKDAERIVRGITPESVVSSPEIVAGIFALIEGITRNLTGKIVNEGLAVRALDELGLPYVQDKGGARQIRGVFMESRSDFALPCNNAPQVIVDVRKSSTRHAALYSSDLSNCIADKITKYPKALAVFLYDGEWTGPAMERLKLAYDWVFHVNDSALAAEIIRRHMAGEDMRKKKRIYYTHVPPGTLDEIKAAFVKIIGAQAGCVLTEDMAQAMSSGMDLICRIPPEF